jgi:hypothetical protein
MSKQILVFNHDTNPAVDRPSFFVTRAEAQRRVSANYAVFVAHNAIQHRPPAGWQRDERGLMISSLFKQAWAPRMSANYLVWQMRSLNAGFR